MNEIKRKSPVQFDEEPAEIETRDHWPVVLAYQTEGPGPWIVDLSHKTRWDFQDSDMDGKQPEGLSIPSQPGACRLEKDMLISRLNPIRAAFWHLAKNADSATFQETAFTDITEATAFLALFGPGIFGITEKLSALDFLNPEQKPPFLLQGPFSHVSCRIVLLQRETADPKSSGVLLLTCARGYARDMVAATLEAGAEFGLRPSGETAFSRYLEKTFEQI